MQFDFSIAVEVAGWLGAALILLAYCLVTIGRLDGRSILFQSLNVAGAAGLVANGLYHGAIPNAALNVIWLLIGIAAILRASKI